MKTFNILLISVLISIVSVNSFCKNFDYMVKDRLIIFSATWCGPCKAMKRDMFERPTEKMIDLLNSYEVIVYDIDISKEETKKYKVSSVPTLVIEQNDLEVNRMIGYSSSKLYSFLQNNKGE